MHLFEYLYYLGFSVKENYSLKRQRRLPCKVISIGNITVGGTGKTPATIAVAEEAQRRGLRPVVLTRGYRGTAEGPCFVTKGDRPLLSFREAGDEPVLMAEKLSGVPIIKNADRFMAGAFGLRELGIGPADLSNYLFILDDGFQHRSLYRDKDVVLIDSSNPFGNGRLLPLGRLREPLKALSRADVIVLTKADAAYGPGQPAAKAIAGRIREYSSKSSVFFSRHIPVSFTSVNAEERPAAWISGKKVFGFCGLGSPDSFRKSLAELGAEVCGFRAFRDHYLYRPEDISVVRKEAERCGANWIVTTEKDIMKTGKRDMPDNLLALKVSFSIEKDFYDAVFASAEDAATTGGL